MGAVYTKISGREIEVKNFKKENGWNTVGKKILDQKISVKNFKTENQSEKLESEKTRQWPY